MSRNLIDDELAWAVAQGLGATPKRLPHWLFYDAAGSALYERITALPEYYLTRTERAIFAAHARAILACALGEQAGRAVTVIELGAGSADKTMVLLGPLATLAPGSAFVPVDLSPTALVAAERNAAQHLPELATRPWVMTHDKALDAATRVAGPKLVLFIGSSLGNYDDDDAVALLTRVRTAIGAQGALVLGTDLKKDPALLVPAYDDAAGVTAAFDMNVLARINRELGGDFALDGFRHVAVWNAARSQIEMHLESTREQRVLVRVLDRTFAFAAGERIHTESSIKYDLARVDALFARAGLVRAATFEDDAGWFGVHVARAA